MVNNWGIERQETETIERSLLITFGIPSIGNRIRKRTLPLPIYVKIVASADYV